MDDDWRIVPESAHKRDAGHLWLGTAHEDHDALTATFRTPAVRDGGVFAELMEVQRQAGIVYAHRALAVPADAVFMLTSISLDLRPSIAGALEHPVQGTVRVTRAAEAGAVRMARAAALRFVLEAPGARLGSGAASVKFLPIALYDRVRHGVAIAPDVRGTDETSAAILRRAARSDPARIRAREVRSNPADPILADHTGDHLSAMAMVCEIEDAVRSDAEPRALVSLHIAFMSYAELSPVPTLVFVVAADGAIEGAVHQSGLQRAVFTGRTARMSTHH
ncbi:MAG TPA: hypothetical protein VNJ54_19270 [Plantibacter sp.]|uniref:hypothetical protein n=1 Tax=unclassified Plantibacter TaxID=2624265 RepID=UPI002C4C494A|nr:hypothetical protein [Plantibacter sp.]